MNLNEELEASQELTSKELVMQFDPNTIEHLGIQMYSTLPPVIAELVSNSYDAEAKSVDIYMYDKFGEKKIIIQDTGHGMTFLDINEKFLKIGRNRRISENSQKTENNKRWVIGKKGIGKLSFFGVASIIEVETIRNSLKNVFKLDWEELKKSGANYKPEVISKDVSTKDQNGTKITLTKLKRKTPFDIESIAYNLSKTFSIFDEPDFIVKIIHNDNIESAKTVANKMRFQNIETEFEWDFPLDIEIEYSLSESIKGKVISAKETVPAAMKGITLFSRGKLVNEPEFYDEKATSFGYSYITGWLNIDFIDSWDKDVISTNRRSLNWEDEDAALLRTYLTDVVKFIYREQRKKRKEKQKKLIMETSKIDIDKWLSDLPRHEKKLAQKIVNSILNAEGLPTEKQGDLVKYVKDSFQYESFKELASEIGEDNVSPDKLIEFFKEWKTIESREFYKLSIVRIQTIKNFEKHIKENAKEVPIMHSFLSKFSWLLDPRLLNFKEEVTYSRLLRENFIDSSEIENDRRIDFLCHMFGDSLFIIELKRPEKVISNKELDQALSYVSFIKSKLSNEFKNNVYCYIIGKKLAETPEVNLKAKSYSESNLVFFKPYESLLSAAIKYHQEFVDRYEEMNISDDN